MNIYLELEQIVKILVENDFEVVGKIMTGWESKTDPYLEKYEINTLEGIPLQKSVAVFKSKYNALYGE